MHFQKINRYYPLFTGRERIYLHMTDPENIPSILELGLIPGFKDGMGAAGFQSDPRRRRCCKEGVFVVLPGRQIADTKSAHVYIITDKTPQPDVNYRSRNRGFLSGYFAVPCIPPLSSIRPGDNEGIYCFIVAPGGKFDAKTSKVLTNLGAMPDQLEQQILPKVLKSFPAHFISDRQRREQSPEPIRENVSQDTLFMFDEEM